jgi:hypothetical protein
MELTSKQLDTIYSALISAQRYLYSDLECMCDDDYKEETLAILDEINKAIDIVPQ